jgi:hypothetical protein
MVEYTPLLLNGGIYPSAALWYVPDTRKIRYGINQDCVRSKRILPWRTTSSHKDPDLYGLRAV